MNPNGEPTIVTFLNQYNSQLHYKYPQIPLALLFYQKHFFSSADRDYQRSPEMVKMQRRTDCGVATPAYLQQNPTSKAQGTS